MFGPKPFDPFFAPALLLLLNGFDKKMWVGFCFMNFLMQFTVLVFIV